MHVVAYAIAAVLYLAASVRYAMRFARARSGATALVAVIVYAGVACHLVGVGFYWARFGEPPLVGLGPSLASLALLLGLAIAGFAHFRSARPLGLFLAPAAALLLVLALLIGIEPTGSVLAFRGTWLAIHISAGFIGYAGWLVSAAAALMYLLQLRQLKHKQLGAIFEFFPPLETLDELAEWALITGFCAMTLGIAIGWAWTIRFEGGFRWTDPKVIWGVLAWLAMLLAIWMRFSRLRTPRQAAMWNVAGFTVVFVAYLAARMVIPETQFFL
ncbi:MAG: cytochrome c biogenesis protein CcsA [Gemmatimonadota bacterium]|nr:MAG: cytochrome c biogenesis protein CcsA [Gemmatimonadota bacterium]